MRYQLLGNHTGLRVSTLALGTLMFGTRSGYGCEPGEAGQILRTYLEAGGNFVDTADSYQSGQSEEILGELLDGVRDDIILSTKYTEGAEGAAGLLTVGNSRKNMVRSLESSLKRLRTDRIDLLWVHMPDGVTPVEEILRGLDDLARAGKILYGGLSDFQAWRTARAQTIAELRGILPISAVQFEYSLLERSADRELLPMADALGIARFAWSPLAGGSLTGKYRRETKGRLEGLGGGLLHSETSDAVSRVIDAVLLTASELGVAPAQVAIAWAIEKGVLPILGVRTLEQLKGTLGSDGVSLDSLQVKRLDDASAVPLGFPHAFLAGEYVSRRLAAGQVVEGLGGTVA